VSVHWPSFAAKCSVFQFHIQKYIKMYLTTIFPVVCTGVKLGLSHLGGKHGLRLFGIGCRGRFRPIRDEATGVGKT